MFRLKRELQRLNIEDLEQAKGRTSLPEVRRGGKVVDVDRLTAAKAPRRRALNKHNILDEQQVAKIVAWLSSRSSS